MGDNRCQQHHYLQNPPRSELVSAGGGCHIVKSTGRKDRHSKVSTAKGPRDRRVRLAAHTAIQFYDVQDRLGYDRPSKAVDWLINKAKIAIDGLPISGSVQNPNFQQEIYDGGDLNFLGSVTEPSYKSAMVIQGNENHDGYGNGSGFLPNSMDSDAIKSFFPMEASNSSAMEFPNFTEKPGLLSRANSHSQDLKLSLQSFQDPAGQAIFTGSVTELGYGDLCGSEHHEHHQKLTDWNVGGGYGYLSNSPPPPPLFQQLFGGQHQFLSSQREPLQSRNTPRVRAWMEPSPAAARAISSGGAGDDPSAGFSGFRIPARIQGEEEEHDGISDKLSSASSDS